MHFEFEPGVGAKPILFGMSSAEVVAILGESPTSSHSNPTGRREDFGALGINYDSDDRVAEICFLPNSDATVSLDRNQLLGSEAGDPNEILERYDSAPIEKLGFLIYNTIGANTCGYHDGDHSQRAVNIFKVGHWDEILKAERRG